MLLTVFPNLKTNQTNTNVSQPKMLYKILETLLIYEIMATLAFDDLFIQGQLTNEMVDLGRDQYQLLRERSNLPHYGPCWRSAIERVDDGCKHLSEDSQAAVALHLTNCFLAMSGHEVYHCDGDRKPNLRGICISSMSDRAFNVYSKFFTHTQHMCWFLRAQIWQETIEENAFSVGKQLAASARSQAELLAAQKAALDAQQRLLAHGEALEKVLEQLHVGSTAHKELLGVLANSFTMFQAWALGEMSWFDSLLFYGVSGAFIFILTASKRTENARLVLGLLLLTNLVLERILCTLWLSNSSSNAHLAWISLYQAIWYMRQLFVLIEFGYLIYFALRFRDFLAENNRFLRLVVRQNERILCLVDGLKHNFGNRDEIRVVNESFEFDKGKKMDFDCNESNSSGFSELKEPNRSRRTFVPNKSKSQLALETPNKRYNLRSTQNTPDLH